MKLIWTRGLDEDRSKEVRVDFIAAKHLRLRLEELLRRKLAAAHKEGMSKDDLDNPNWPYKQAYKVGFERALEEVISLLKD